MTLSCALATGFFSCAFLLIVLLSSIVVLSRAWESSSDALLWKFARAIATYSICPQLDCEDLFCNAVQI